MESMTLLDCNLFTIFCRILIKWQHIQITVFLVLQNKEKKKTSGIKHSVKGQQVKNNPGIIFIKILQNDCWFLGRKKSHAERRDFSFLSDCFWDILRTYRYWKIIVTRAFNIQSIHHTLFFLILYRLCNKEA